MLPYLGQSHGLFASEDLGTLEKFRPYGIPTDQWLAEVKRRFTQPKSVDTVPGL